MTKQKTSQAVEVIFEQPAPRAPETFTVSAEDDGDAGPAFEPVAVPKFEMPRALVARPYWFGIKPSAPFDNFDCRAIGFMKFSGPPPCDDDGVFNPSKIARCGLVRDLTDAQVAAVRERIVTEVFERVRKNTESYSPQGQRRTYEVASPRLLVRPVYDRRTDKTNEVPNAPTGDWEWYGFHLYLLGLDSPEVKALMRRYPDSWFKRPEAVEELPSLVSVQHVLPRVAQAA